MDGPSLLFLYLLIIPIPMTALSLPTAVTALLGKMFKARQAQGPGLPLFILSDENCLPGKED